MTKQIREYQFGDSEFAIQENRVFTKRDNELVEITGRRVGGVIQERPFSLQAGHAYQFESDSRKLTCLVTEWNGSPCGWLISEDNVSPFEITPDGLIKQDGQFTTHSVDDLVFWRDASEPDAVIVRPNDSKIQQPPPQIVLPNNAELAQTLQEIASGDTRRAESMLKTLTELAAQLREFVSKPVVVENQPANVSVNMSVPKEAIKVDAELRLPTREELKVKRDALGKTTGFTKERTYEDAGDQTDKGEPK